MGTSLSELSHVVRAYEGLADVDIIHDHTLAGPLYMHRPGGIPVVTTIHGPLHARAADIYRAIARAGAVIAISRDQASHAPGVPVTRVIHHGMDLRGGSGGNGRRRLPVLRGPVVPGQGPAGSHQHRP